MIELGGSHKLNTHASDARGKFNGKLSEAKTRSTKKPRSFLSWIFSFAARFSIWAVVLTVLFRCPSAIDLCDETSPLICKHYFQARNAVSPHIKSYFDLHATPYVNAAKPYYDAMNTHVFTPTGMYTKRYAAPWAKRGLEHAWLQWHINGKPRLERVRKVIQERHAQTIAPHLETAHRIFQPFYVMARINTMHLFHHSILPSYNFVRPYFAKGYSAASDITTSKAIPATYWMWRQGIFFLQSIVWPHLRHAYVENVEPQLVRIGERLGRYKHSAKSKVLPQRTSSGHSAHAVPASSDPVLLTATHTPASAEKVSVSSCDEQNEHSSQKYRYPMEAPPSTENESQSDRQIREMVAHDLKTWQEIFVKQVEEGTTDIEECVDKIGQRSVDEHVDTEGKRLLTQLNVTVVAEFANLRSKISLIVKVAHDDAENEITRAIRSAGMAVKNRAQEIRKWREEFDAQLQRAVEDSVQEHFDILDEMRSLALQKIGMKWVWTNGITYRDWAKYHELRNTFYKRTDELQQLVVSNPSLLMAQHASADIEEEAMEIASVAAKELGRLKKVAHWKVVAGDSTDDFGTESMRLVAEAVQKAHIAKSADMKSKDSLKLLQKDRLDMGYSPLKIFPSVVGHVALESIPADRENLAPVEIEDCQNSLILADQNDVESNGRERRAVTNGHPIDELQDPTSSNMYEPNEPTGVAGRSKSSDDTGRVIDSNAEGTIMDTVTIASHRPRSQPPTVNQAIFGAAAQVISDRRPVLDTSSSCTYGSATATARAAYTHTMSAAAERYSNALSTISAQVYGTPNSVYEKLFASVSAAYQRDVSAASHLVHRAINTASCGIQQKATPTSSSEHLGWNTVESIAAQRLNEGRFWAEMQYQSALIALGATATITATASSPAEKLVEKAKLNYYAGLGMAEDQYTRFLSAASLAWSSITATETPTSTGFAGSASSAASVASGSASSAVQVATSAAQSVCSAAADGLASAAKAVKDSFSAATVGAVSAARAIEEADEQMFTAGSVVAESWVQALLAISSQVYGEATCTGWNDELIEQAATLTTHDTTTTRSAQMAQQYEAVAGMMSELVDGREPAFSESILSRLGAIFFTVPGNAAGLASEATTSAASATESLNSLASQATETVRQSIQLGRDEL